MSKDNQEKQENPEKVQVSINDTGEGIEIQQGIVGVDINMVEENISVELNNKTWFSISFSGVYQCLGQIATGCLNICNRTATVTTTPVVETPTEIQPVAEIQVQAPVPPVPPVKEKAISERKIKTR